MVEDAFRSLCVPGSPLCFLAGRDVFVRARNHGRLENQPLLSSVDSNPENQGSLLLE